MDHTLICIQNLQREHGWRTMKRPGIEYFIGYLSQFYEIVIFTSQYAYVRRVCISVVLHGSNALVSFT